jgi:hypothetical protein
MKSNLLKAGLTAALLLVAVNAPAPLLTWSTSPNATIPDNQPNAGLLSTITINSGDSQLTSEFGANPYWVQNLSSLSLNISGGWNGDYKVVLTHLNPDLTLQNSITLFNRMGVDGSNPGGYANAGFNSTVFSMSAGSAISSAGSYVSTSQIGAGPYLPDGGVNFNGFQNATPLGIWALYITDNMGGDVGTLGGWSLTLDVVPEPTTWALGTFGVLLAGRMIWWRWRAGTPVARE